MAQNSLLVFLIFLLVSVNAQDLKKPLGNDKSTTITLNQGVAWILAMEEFTSLDKKENLAQILLNSKLDSSYSDRYIAEKRTILLRTPRGYECFKFMRKKSGKLSLLNYARGMGRLAVYQCCRGNSPATTAEHVEDIFSLDIEQDFR